MKNIIRRFKDWFAGPVAASGQPEGPTAGIRPGYLVCLETGVRKSVLHRHVRQTLGMTPDQYRKKWGLPPDYPMVSEAYLRRRDAVRRKKNHA